MVVEFLNYHQSFPEENVHSQFFFPCPRLAVTKYGINGASLVTVLSLAVILICMQIGSPDSLKDNLKLDWRFFAKLVLASGSMALVVNWSKLVLLGLFPDVGRIELGIIVVAVVLLGGLTFIGVAIGVRLFTIREWLTIPYGKKLLKKIVR